MDSLADLLHGIFLHWHFLPPERFVLAAEALLLALVAGFITGPQTHSATPLFWRLIDATFGRLGVRLDNMNRNPSDLISRGVILVIFLILFTGALGIWLETRLPLLPVPSLFEVLIVSCCLSTGAVIHHDMRLHQVLKGARMSDGTYLTLARTSRINFMNRDDSTLTRTGIEILVRLFDKACVAPLLWYVLAGLPGLLIYSALSAFAWQHGYDGNYRGIGSAALALEKLMGFVPTLFSASLIGLTPFIVPGTNPVQAMKGFTNPKDTHPYDEGGSPVSVAAGALNITLGGAVTHLNGRMMKRAWTGPKSATAQIQADHLKRALYMIFIAEIYFVAALLCASLWGQL